MSLGCLETGDCCRRAGICRVDVSSCRCLLLRNLLSLYLPRLAPRFFGVVWTVHERSEVQSVIAKATAHLLTKNDSRFPLQIYVFLRRL